MLCHCNPESWSSKLARLESAADWGTHELLDIKISAKLIGRPLNPHYRSIGAPPDHFRRQDNRPCQPQPRHQHPASGRPRRHHPGVNSGLGLDSLGFLAASLGGWGLLGDLAGCGVGSAASLGLLNLGSLLGRRSGSCSGIAVRHGTPLLLDLAEAGGGCLAIAEARLLSNDIPINL